MEARSVQFQQQLQEKDDEINRLRRELEILKGEVHIISTCIHSSSSMIWLHVQLENLLI